MFTCELLYADINFSQKEAGSCTVSVSLYAQIAVSMHGCVWLHGFTQKLDTCEQVAMGF